MIIVSQRKGGEPKGVDQWPRVPSKEGSRQVRGCISLKEEKVSAGLPWGTTSYIEDPVDAEPVRRKMEQELVGRNHDRNIGVSLSLQGRLLEKCK